MTVGGSCRGIHAHRQKGVIQQQITIALRCTLACLPAGYAYEFRPIQEAIFVAQLVNMEDGTTFFFLLTNAEFS